MLEDIEFLSLYIRLRSVAADEFATCDVRRPLYDVMFFSIVREVTYSSSSARGLLVDCIGAWGIAVDTLTEAK